MVGAGAGADIDLRCGERGEARQRQTAGSHGARRCVVLGGQTVTAGRQLPSSKAGRMRREELSGSGHEAVLDRGGEGSRLYAAAAQY